MVLKIKCSCGCRGKLTISESALERLELEIEGNAIEIKEKQAVKIINFLTKWLDQQRIMNNERLTKEIDNNHKKR
jgi:hypothetical protein